MSDTTVFAFGLFVLVLLFGGLLFTVIEMKRVGREAESRRPSHKAPVSILPAERV
jgi:hypothetical protein